MVTKTEAKQQQRLQVKKDKAQAKAKALPKAKAKAQGKSQTQKSARDQSGRRQTPEEKAERFVEDHLFDLTPEEIYEKLAGEPPMTCWDRVVHKKRENMDGRVSTGEIGELRSMYKQKVQSSSLVPKVKGEAIAKELKLSVAQSMLKNAFDKDLHGLEHYLSLRTTPLKETEVMMILKSFHGRNLCMESEALHVTQVLQALVDAGCHTLFPAVFSSHRRMWDDALVVSLRQAMANDELGKDWVARHSQALGLITDVAALRKCLAADRLGDEYDVVMGLLKESQVAHRLFKDDVAQLVCDRYASRVSTKISELNEKNAPSVEQCNTTLDAIRELATEAAEKLKQYPRAKLTFKLDIASHHVQHSVKNLQVHQGMVWGAFVRSRNEGHDTENCGIKFLLPQVWMGKHILPTGTKQPLPAQFSKKIQAGRARMNKIITDGYLSSNKHIKNSLTKHANHLKSISPDVTLDFLIVGAIADRDGPAAYRQQFKDVMPCKDSHKSFSEVLSRFDTIKQGKLAAFLTSHVRGEIEAHVAVVSYIMKGKMTESQYSALEGFKKEMAEACSWILRFVEKDDDMAEEHQGLDAFGPLLDHLVKNPDDKEGLNKMAQFSYLCPADKKSTFEKIKDKVGGASPCVEDVTPQKKKAKSESSSAQKKGAEKTEQDAILEDLENWFE